MADRYPLIYNPSANQIQELQSGDSLDVGSSLVKNATGYATSTGTSSQFLKADGSSDSNTYLTSAGTIALAQGLTGSPSITVGAVSGTTGTFSGNVSAVNVSASSSVTAAKFYGDGSSLTGIDASSLKDGSNIKVQATATGATVTGNVAATGNVTAVDVTASGNVSAVNATFSGDLTVNGTTTTIDTDVTEVDSLAVDGNITIGSTVDAPDFTNTGSKHITIGSPADALLVTHSSGQGLGYFGYEAGGDRLVVACDGGSGGNKIDFITDAGTTAGADNLDGKVPKMRINSSGDVSVNTTANGSNAKFEVKSTTGSITSATSRINGGETSTGAINTGASLLLSGHDGVNERDFASLFAGKEKGTSGNHDAYLAFGT